MSDDNANLLLLFQKPLEPMFTVTGNGQAQIDLPEEYYPDRYKEILSDVVDVTTRSRTNTIYVDPVPIPDLSFADSLKKTDGFSLFSQNHKEIAAKLTKIFLDAPDAKSMFSMGTYIRDRVNVYCYQYALSVAMQHRSDTKNVEIPAIPKTFPDLFVASSILPKGREELQLVKGPNRMNIDIPLNYTASDKEAEQRMAYFREDIGVNMHHWHWHLVYPGTGEDNVVRKDRRGELFYYMHNQIINRYNVDRMCNGLERVWPLNDLRVAVPEGYFPKLIRSANNQAYPPRASNTQLRDVNRSDGSVEIGDIERWRDRIYQAIDEGHVVDANGLRISLMDGKGIDILGDVVEASTLTPNRRLYGSIHNEGHNIISFVHDPDEKHLEGFGVMGGVETAMRDPIFYRWHSFIDSIFARHKRLIAAYHPETEFIYNGITVNSVSVLVRAQNASPNILLTYWQKSDVDLRAGLDFGKEGNVYAQFTHLQHAPFDYTINVRNSNSAQRMATVRIFVCPVNDERGNKLNFEDQRKLMIEMDKFMVPLKPGMNTIRRKSEDSSVTIPYERSLRNIGKSYQIEDERLKSQFQFCGCGWPQHMLLPRGSVEGTQFNIFVMLSNYELDRVEQPESNNPCNDAAVFCGLKDQKYPDKRPIGFPFDRPFTFDRPSARLLDFKNLASNMAIGELSIRFTNALVDRS